jgi:hypothetical protein
MKALNEYRAALIVQRDTFRALGDPAKPGYRQRWAAWCVAQSKVEEAREELNRALLAEES